MTTSGFHWCGVFNGFLLGRCSLVVGVEDTVDLVYDALTMVVVVVAFWSMDDSVSVRSRQDVEALQNLRLLVDMCLVNVSR